MILNYYGKHMAKVSLETIERLKDRPYGKLIYTTAITLRLPVKVRPVLLLGLLRLWGENE